MHGSSGVLCASFPLLNNHTQLSICELLIFTEMNSELYKKH